MAWKILTSLTAVCVAAIATFSYLNLKDLNDERQLLEFAKTNREDTADRKEAGMETLANTQETIAATGEELDARRTELAETNRRISDKEADIARVTQQLQQVRARVAKLEDQISAIGSVDDLIATAQGLDKSIEENRATIANRQEQLAIATNKLANLKSEISSYQELEGRQRAGRMKESFEAKVASVVPSWGFVILDRGNLAGAFTNATLDVKRNDETVGQLRIGNVEQKVAFADVLPGTFEDGDMPRQGDRVVPAEGSDGAMSPDEEGGFGLPDLDSGEQPDAAAEPADDAAGDPEGTTDGDDAGGSPFDLLDESMDSDDEAAPDLGEPMDGAPMDESGPGDFGDSPF